MGLSKYLVLVKVRGLGSSMKIRWGSVALFESAKKRVFDECFDPSSSYQCFFC
jgi:hypothetical protein